MLIFGSDLIARDVSSSKNVVAWTISREWLAYADDQFYLLIRANRPYDFAQPQQDRTPSGDPRRRETPLRPYGAHERFKLAFIGDENAGCGSVISALDNKASSFPWSYVVDLGGSADTEIWVDDTDGASAIWSTAEPTSALVMNRGTNHQSPAFAADR